jgi:hypothetical protein
MSAPELRDYETHPVTRQTAGTLRESGDKFSSALNSPNYSSSLIVSGPTVDCDHAQRYQNYSSVDASAPAAIPPSAVDKSMHMLYNVVLELWKNLILIDSLYSSFEVSLVINFRKYVFCTIFPVHVLARSLEEFNVVPMLWIPPLI